MEEFVDSVNTEEVADPQTEQDQNPIEAEANISDDAQTDDAQTDDAPQNTNLNDEQVEQGAKDEEFAEPQAQRDFEKDAAFAKMRREMEQTQRENKRLQSALKGFDFHGQTADELADEAEAYHTGRSVEEIRRAREERAKIEALEEECKTLRARESARVFADDLAEIKKQYPDADIKNIRDLGDDFMRLRASGVDNLMAYEVVRRRQEMDKKPIPPSTGSVKSTGGAVKEYFTADEVRAMSPAEVKKNYEKIRKSMKKW